MTMTPFLVVVILPIVFHFAIAKTVSLNINTEESWSVKHNEPYKFLYNQPVGSSLRIYVERRPSFVTDFPVYILVRQLKTIYVFQLPMIVDSKYIYWNMSRTICPLNHPEEVDMSSYPLAIEISTDLPSQFEAAVGKIRIASISDFRLEMQRPFTFSLTPPEPQFFLFTIPRNASSVDIRVSSNTSECMKMSIQRAKCPVYDELQKIDSSAIYQTVSMKGHLRVQSRDYVNSSFFLVFVLKPDEKGCLDENRKKNLRYSNSTMRSKEVTIVLKETHSPSSYVLPICFTFGIILLLYCIFFTGFYIQARLLRKEAEQRNHSSASEESGTVELRASESRLALPLADGEANHHNQHDLPRVSVISPEEDAERERRPVDSTQENLVFSRAGPRSSSPALEETEMVEFTSQGASSGLKPVEGDASHEIHISPHLSMIAPEDVVDGGRSHVDHRLLREKHNMFRRFIIVIALFYCLPIIQLTTTYHQIANTNNDFCFHNYYCSRPWGPFTAFNNLLSNLYFVMLGFLFLVATLVRSRLLIRYPPFRGQNPSNMAVEYGFPEHNGIYFAMGFALMIEGVMSCIYHVCPSTLNYQFDTAFMYMMSALGMVRIYHSRHPHNNGTAHLVFTMLAIALMIGVVGSLRVDENWSYGAWVVFCISFFFFSLYVSIDIYNRGDWSWLSLDRLRRLPDDYQENGCGMFKPIHKRTLMLLVVGNTVNFFIIWFMNEDNFFKFLLTLICIDILAYYSYYIGMKFVYTWIVQGEKREKIPRIVYVYLLLAAVCWGFAFYFFRVQRSYSWRTTPARSREYNKDCIFLDFFDGHDVWHFLSAMALFFTFMVILHIDDDLVYKKRGDIAVF